MNQIDKYGTIRKTFFLIWVSALFLVSCANISAPDTLESDEKNSESMDENTWIFLMAGQSNMAGRGTLEPQDIMTNDRIITINENNEWVAAKEPLHFYEPAGAGLDCGMSFANELLKHIPDSITIALIPCAVGGSSVFQWLNDDEHRGVKLYSNFVQKVQLSKKKGVIKGILWHQGESNANPTDMPDYEEGVLNLFDRFRKIVADESLPIIMGEIGRFAQPEEKAGYFENINEIIRKLAEENDHLFSISSEGLDHKGDHLHFNSEGQRLLGLRFAHVFSEVLDE